MACALFSLRALVALRPARDVACACLGPGYLREASDSGMTVWGWVRHARKRDDHGNAPNTR